MTQNQLQPAPATNPLPTLAYADLPTRYGISFARDGDCLTMSIAVSAWKRILAIVIWIPMLVLILSSGWFALITLAFVLGLVLWRRTLDKPIATAGGNAAGGGVFGFGRCLSIGV